MYSKPKRILVLAGGRSNEHDISIASARSVFMETHNTNLDITVIIITRDGRWLSASESMNVLYNGYTIDNTYTDTNKFILHNASMNDLYDIVFPLLHGPFGEDGRIQGMLESIGIPYIGCGVLASALCMDKTMTRHVLHANGFPQTKFCPITKHDYFHNNHTMWQNISKLRPPWFVKPANLGSSIGISKVCKKAYLCSAIKKAFEYDNRIIIEEGIIDAIEFEIGIIGNDHISSSPVGQLIYNAEFFDYETKYTKGKLHLQIPADIPVFLEERITSMSLDVFRLLDCKGLARVDFLYQPKYNALFVNEINTMPGFTTSSVFPKLWEAAGVSYSALINKITDFAVDSYCSQNSTYKTKLRK